MKNSEQIIEGSDFEIETEKKLLFKSKKGNYFLTRDSAIDDSITHKKCEKHEYIYEVRSYCPYCAEERAINSYKKNMKRVEWDGSYSLYSRTSEEYYFDYESLINDVEILANENNIKLNEQMLKMEFQLCESHSLREVEIDYWEDVWFDGADLPDEISDALDSLNKTIKNYGKNFSWSTINKSVIIDLKQLNDS